MYVSALVEGSLDEIVATHLIRASGHEINARYGKRGVGYIKSRINGFNSAAAGCHILALVDFMDTKLRCPPEVVRTWLPYRHQNMLFRVVVNEIESWLLADSVNIARYLGVARRKVPNNPEGLADPKQTLINLARDSRYIKIREAIVPREGASATEGSAYTSELGRFVFGSWDIQAARQISPSLDSCLRQLESL